MQLNKLSILLAPVLMALVLVLAVHTAQHKLFWADEGYDICTLSGYSSSTLLLGQTVQPNNNPLYSLLQKAAITFSPHSTDDILISFRLVSIMSACLIVVSLYYFALGKFGIFGAVLGVLTLINQGLFFQFAAESRHYMLWLLCFTWLVIATTSVCSQRYQEVTLKKKITFFLACLANTLVISMGAIQVLAAGCTCLLCWVFIYPNKDKSASALKFSLLVMMLCLGLEVYYASQHPSLYSTYAGSPWDIIANAQKGDYSLLKMPLRLLFPKPMGEAYLGIVVSNIFALAGLCVPFLYWKKKKELTKTESVVLALSIATLLQILATIVIAAIIIYTRFYFVQRVFLYLIICDCFLTLIGVFVVCQFVSQRFLSQKYLSILKVVLTVVLMALAFRWQAENYQAEVKAEVNCEFTGNRLGEDLQTMLNTNNVSCARLNLVVEVSKRIKQCGWFPTSDFSKLSLWKDNTNVWYLTERMPVDAKPFRGPFVDCK